MCDLHVNGSIKQMKNIHKCANNTATHRRYLADIYTSDQSSCETSSSVTYYFLSNCTYSDSSNVPRQYCNPADSVSTRSTSNTFSPDTYDSTITYVCTKLTLFLLLTIDVICKCLL